MAFVLGFRIASEQISFGLTFGPDARAEFEGLHQTFGGHFIDFNGLSSGTRLDNEFVANDGVSFASNISIFGVPLSNPQHMLVHVIGAPPNPDLIGTIVGTPSSISCCDDGRVGYEISFSTPQRWAGLLRIWNTSTTTQLFDEMGNLLAPQHFNTIGNGNEFVGYIAASDDSAD